MRIAIAAAVLAALSINVAGAAADSYVALGDSYAAGPIIPLQIQPYGCLKSDHNYAHLAAPSLKPLTLRDPSCSGAETDDMTQEQGVSPGPNPPEFNSLEPATKLVTVQIGGNDIGFSGIAEDCFNTSPHRPPCRGR